MVSPPGPKLPIPSYKGYCLVRRPLEKEARPPCFLFTISLKTTTLSPERTNMLVTP